MSVFDLPSLQFLAAAPFIGFLAIEFLLGPLVFLILFVAGRWMKRRRGVPFGISYIVFSLAVSAFLPLYIFGIEFPYRSIVMMNLVAAMIIFGAAVILALIQRYFWELWFEKRHQSRAPKFLSQIFALLVFIAAILIALAASYGIDINSFVLSSTVVVGIIGFAMQDLLGNIIAGVSIEIGKPFRVGNWLVVEGKHMEVMETNWRSVRLRDTDDIYYDIPNKTMVGTTITNLTYPNRVHAIRIQTRFDYNIPPNAIKDCLLRATSAAKGVLPNPPPSVFLKDFADHFIVYEVRFWIEDESRFSQTLDAIRTNIWYETQREGFKIPMPIRTVQIERPGARRDKLEAARAAVRKQPILSLIPPSQLDQLLMSARFERFGRGEKIIRQGDDGGSMFVLVRGQADVFIEVDGEDRHVATLRDGDCAGEMSLLTGERRSATVIAVTDCEVWEIGKDTLQSILQDNEMLVQQLGDLLARRRLEMDGVAAAPGSRDEIAARQREYRQGFLTKLYRFFEL